MKYVKIFFAVALVFSLCSAFSLKKGAKPVYAFGVSASFTDTLVYYTEVQLLDSVSLDKHGFLPKQELYSYELKYYMEQTLQKENRTCMIYFADSKKKIDKELSKVLGKYKKNKSVSLVLIPSKDFQFTKPED